MWWGYSPPLDLQSEVNEKEDICINEHLEVLIAGAGDARHIVKTIASSYSHPQRSITYHVIEPTLEQVGRSILFLNICVEENIGLQEATRYYLEILGNTLLRPATAKYLASTCNYLRNIPTQTVDCPWLNLERFKHRDRDSLESIFKFWERATREGVPIVDYWDRRIQKALKTRYDYRDGVFDWDYHMVLKSRNASNLTIQEYKFWRNNGVAFTWLEGEPARSNPTLLSNILQHGNGFVHYAYLGDITNGPFFTWGFNETSNKQTKLRATDAAEREIMRAIYEIRTKEPMCDEYIAAHRDPSLLNAIIVTEMPDSKMELESWTACNNYKSRKVPVSWTDISNHKVVFHPVASLEFLKNKAEYLNRFHVTWVAHNMTKHLPNLSPLLRKGAPVLVESRKFLAELRKEGLEAFTEELKKTARESELRETSDFDSKEHLVARFCKK